MSNLENINFKEDFEINREIKQAELTRASQIIFENIVSKEYLHDLTDCKVLPLAVNKGYAGVSWYRINKIVTEKDVFFPDKLSMLYNSLHKNARNVALVLNKKSEEEIELYIGARDYGKEERITGEILEAGLNGFFPGIEYERVKNSDIFGLKSENNNLKLGEEIYVTSVSAIASLRDDKKEEFVQGLERLINATDTIKHFKAFFIAEGVSYEESKNIMESFSKLYTSLSPTENLQMTYNESESKGISESFTENFSKTVGENISRTLTHTDGFTDTAGESYAEGSSENYSYFILKSIWRGLWGGQTGYGKNSSHTNNYNRTENFSDAEATQNGSSINIMKGTSNQKGKSSQTTHGLSKQITYKNRTSKYYLDTLDKQIERLQNGIPFGLWAVATYFVADTKTTSQQLANIYRGAIIGEESGIESCALNSWEEQSAVEINKYLYETLHPRFNFNSLNLSASTVVNSKELAIHLSLPQTSVPGIIVEERATFARNVLSKNNKKKEETEKIDLGYIDFLGRVSKSPVKLELAEFTKHMFVTGSTGSGKSNTLYLILNQLIDKGKTFMVIEPAKGEYKHIFGMLENITVYSNTNKVGHVLRINPFEFPYKKIDVLEHIERIVGIFNACWALYAAMPSILKHSIITAYERCGWDMDSSTHKFGENPIFPNVEDVVICIKEYLDNSDYSADTKGDYKGALEKRLQDLCEGMYDRIFNRGSISDEDLFNKNTIIDLSRIGSSETNALIMGFLIVKLNEFRMSEGGMNKELRHVTVLEEAHNLLRKTSVSQSMEGSNVAGKAVEMITNSIAEMRTYGESFIIVDQSPSLLDSAAIRNTNTKIILSLPEEEDRKVAGHSIGLSDAQIKEISRQKQGEAIVYQNNWEEPVQCKILPFKPYKENYVYEKRTPYISRQLREYSPEVLKFLLYPYVRENFNIEKIKQILSSENIPTAVKFTLLRLVDEYTENGILEIWKDHNDIELTKLVKEYLHMDSDYSNILNHFHNMTQVRHKLDLLLKGKLGHDLSLRLLYYIERCYVRNNALFEDWKKTF